MSAKKGSTDTVVVSKGCLQCGVPIGAAADPDVIASYDTIHQYIYKYSPPCHSGGMVFIDNKHF